MIQQPVSGVADFIRVPVPSLDEQKKFVAKVKALEKQIVDAQSVIDAAPARKEAIMKKYL